MTIYEITGEFLALLQMAEDEDVDAQAFADTLEAIKGDLFDKADGYGKVIRQMEHDAAALAAEEKRLANRRRTIEANAVRIKGTLQAAMEATGETKFKTAFFSFGIQKNPPSVILDVPDDAIPEEFRIPQPDKIDKVKIKAALKLGALDFAHLESTESLRIR